MLGVLVIRTNSSFIIEKHRSFVLRLHFLFVGFFLSCASLAFYCPNGTRRRRVWNRLSVVFQTVFLVVKSRVFCAPNWSVPPSGNVAY